MVAIAAIPTTYAGVNFRSRLEARWCAVFDELGWPWTYEPTDTPGYVPDFVLHLWRPVLVEVRPGRRLEELRELGETDIARSRWEGDALVLGEWPLAGGSPPNRLGAMRESFPGPDGLDAGVGWDAAFVFRCLACHAATFACESGSWACRRCWAYEDHVDARFDVVSAWRNAGNATQWRPPR